MKASLCVGEYCENAYNVEGLDIRVYSMEELCYCLKENAFLLDLSIMNDKLVDWIGEECKVWELAKQLYPMVHKQGSLSVFVVTILQYVGMYDPEEILQVEQVLSREPDSASHGERKSRSTIWWKKENSGSHPWIWICYWRPGTIWNRKERNFRREKSGRRSCTIRVWR